MSHLIPTETEYTPAFVFEVKELTEDGIFEGYASTFGGKPDLVNLLLDPAIRDGIHKVQAGWRRTVMRAAEAGIPMLAHSSALAYFDSYRTARLPQSLTQAQRDAFGAHTYERIDRPGAVHSEW